MNIARQVVTAVWCAVIGGVAAFALLDWVHTIDRLNLDWGGLTIGAWSEISALAALAVFALVALAWIQALWAAAAAAGVFAVVYLWRYGVDPGAAAAFSAAVVTAGLAQWHRRADLEDRRARRVEEF